MSNKTKLTAFATAAVVVILFAVGAYFQAGRLEAQKAFTAERATPVDFSPVVEKSIPSLVRIENDSLGEHPGFFGKVGKIQIAKTSEGTGFFIDRNGLILTNYHVVEGAQKLSVYTYNKRTYTAELIGADVLTDIALIRIKPDFKVHPLPLGDSSRAKVGQWVLALGNPLGLDFFTSAGIISGFGPPGRDYIGFYDFIQADLNIEPGNSGGPMLNTKGQVVGINNAYLGPGTKIGFAIPINRAKEVVDQLLSKGSISRGFLGMLGQPVSPGLAGRLGLKTVQGAMVTEILGNSPAETSGLKKMDVVLAFNGEPVQDDRDLQEKVYSSPAKAKTDFLIVRGGKKMHLPVTLGELREHTLITKKAIAQCGINFARIPEKMAQRLGIKDTTGLIVLRVVPGCPAFEGGLRFGDVVKEIEGRKVYSVADFYNVYGKGKPGRDMIVQVMREGRPLYITIKPGETKAG